MKTFSEYHSFSRLHGNKANTTVKLFRIRNKSLLSSLEKGSQVFFPCVLFLSLSCLFRLKMKRRKWINSFTLILRRF